MAFSGEIGKGTDRHVHFNTENLTATREGPGTSWPSVFASLFFIFYFWTILESAQPHFCSLVLRAGWCWPWSEREQKNPEGKYRKWQKNELVNQGWAGLHCVKSARALEGCGQEMALLSQWRRPCCMSQDPGTDTPWGADAEETSEKGIAQLTKKNQQARWVSWCWKLPNLNAF